MKKTIGLAIIGACILYIVNPTLGVWELLPDNLPLVGNLDEAGAVYIMVATLRKFFDIDLTSLFSNEKKAELKEPDKKNKI